MKKVIMFLIVSLVSSVTAIVLSKRHTNKEELKNKWDRYLGH